MDGKFGQALKFDGVTTSIDCGNEVSLEITKEITVMAWVQFDGLDYKNSSGKLLRGCLKRVDKMVLFG